MSRDPDALVRELNNWPGDEGAKRIRDATGRVGMISWGVVIEVLAADCDGLAPILVRHVSPEVRAAILRELVASHLHAHQRSDGVVVLSGTGRDGDNFHLALDMMDLLDAILTPAPEARDA